MTLVRASKIAMEGLKTLQENLGKEFKIKYGFTRDFSLTETLDIMCSKYLKRNYKQIPMRDVMVILNMKVNGNDTVRRSR